MFFTRHTPYLPAAWRHLRAAHLLEHRQRPHKQLDDAWVRRELCFLRELRRCQTDRQRRRLAEREPALYIAHTLASANPPEIRWAIEARLLAGESFAAIATKCYTSPEVVEAYERIHYSVSDRLEACDHIVNVVIGSRVHLDMTEADQDIRWRLLSYLGGPIVADYLIDGGCDDITAAERFLHAHTHGQLLRQLVTLAHIIPVDGDSATFRLFGSLIDLHHRLRTDTETQACPPAQPASARMATDILAAVMQSESSTEGLGHVVSPDQIGEPTCSYPRPLVYQAGDPDIRAISREAIPA